MYCMTTVFASFPNVYIIYWHRKLPKLDPIPSDDCFCLDCVEFLRSSVDCLDLDYPLWIHAYLIQAPFETSKFKELFANRWLASIVEYCHKIDQIPPCLSRATENIQSINVLCDCTNKIVGSILIGTIISCWPSAMFPTLLYLSTITETGKTSCVKTTQLFYKTLFRIRRSIVARNSLNIFLVRAKLIVVQLFVVVFVGSIVLVVLYASVYKFELRRWSQFQQLHLKYILTTGCKSTFRMKSAKMCVRRIESKQIENIVYWIRKIDQTGAIEMAGY